MELRPREPGHVPLYTCGPTVYNVVHVGNLRTFVFEDVLRRHLLASGLRVTQIMNLTDVDDKTIRGATQAGLSLNDFTAQYAEAFFQDIATLNVEKAEKLPARHRAHSRDDRLDREAARARAHVRVGGVGLFPDRVVSGLRQALADRPEQTRRGDRVADDEYEKEDVKDFVALEGREAGRAVWPSPFGPGRPGWHIECSAMSMKYLGPHFDIHTGRGRQHLSPPRERDRAERGRDGGAVRRRVAALPST